MSDDETRHVTNPEAVIRLLQGDAGICGCGRPLQPVLAEDGHQVGATHDAFEDTEWHDRFFGGMRIARLGEEAHR